MWLYSSRKWCSGHHTYLMPLAVGGHADVDVAHDALVLGHGVDVALVARDEQLGEDAEFHAGSFRRHDLGPPRCGLASEQD